MKTYLAMAMLTMAAATSYGQDAMTTAQNAINTAKMQQETTVFQLEWAINLRAFALVELEIADETAWENIPLCCWWMQEGLTTAEAGDQKLYAGRDRANSGIKGLERMEDAFEAGKYDTIPAMGEQVGKDFSDAWKIWRSSQAKYQYAAECFGNVKMQASMAAMMP